ncbi:2089_t:CDS:2, partial [Dentiscutata erythropus]
KDDYIIVSLPEQWNTIAFAAAKSYNNRIQPFMRYSFGQKVKVQIVHVPQHKNDNNVNDNNVIDRVLVALQQAADQEKFMISGTKSIEDFSPGQKLRDFVKDVSALYKTGQHVTAVVLNIDYTTQKVAFGIKNSCFKEYGIDLLDESDQDMDDDMEVEDDAEKSNLQMEIDSDDQESQVSDINESDNEMMEVNNNSQEVEITPLPIS